MSKKFIYKTILFLFAITMFVGAMLRTNVPKAVAQTTPTNREEFLAFFEEDEVYEQFFGSNAIPGDNEQIVAGHTVLFEKNGISFFINFAFSMLHATPDAILAEGLAPFMNIIISEERPVHYLSLNIVFYDIFLNYQGNTPIYVSINNNPIFIYTTTPNMEDNNLIVHSETPITSINIYPVQILTYTGLSSIALASPKITPEAPEAPTVSGTPTSSSITLNTIAGAEYSIDNGITWQDAQTFTGLTPNTEYSFVARIKATVNNRASSSSPVTRIMTDKSTPNTPAAPAVNGTPFPTSIVLVGISGAEYSKDGGTTWQDNTTFTGLTPNTEYSFITRIKATVNSYASANSSVTKIWTAPSAPAAPVASGLPTSTSITLVTIPGAEYSMTGITWQDSPTFTDLTPGTEHYFVARIKATVNNIASPFSSVSIIRTDKSTQNAPSAPVVSGSPTSTSITLEAISGAEYSKDGGTTWQDVPTFTGLTPNTEYSFIARVKETVTSYASTNSTVTKIKTDKSTPDAPSAPIVSSSPTSTTITLITIPGAEYSKDGGTTWQDSPTFTGLTPRTDYSFVARIKATVNSYASSLSALSIISTDKATTNPPSSPVVSGSPTSTSITLEAISGAEYSKDGGTTWQDNQIFTDLMPNTEYSFIARIKGTFSSYTSANSEATVVKTDKSKPNTPSAPVVSGIPSSNSVTLEVISGAEYSKDGGNTWQDNQIFTDLMPNTEYSFVVRIKATENGYASENSEALAVKTDKVTPNTPPVPVVSGTPTSTSITLDTIPGAEYSLDGGSTWQDSPTFNGLTPGTEYTFIARIKATESNYSSDSSEVSARISTAAQPVSENPATDDTNSILMLVSVVAAASLALITFLWLEKRSKVRN